MDPGKIKQGLIALGVVLGELGVFTRLMGGGVNLLATGAGMVILAGSMLLFAKVIEQIGSMPLDKLQTGLIGMGAALLILTLALYGMQGTLAGSAALLVAAVALNLLTPALQALGNMSLTEIGIALLALAGVFLVLGVAGYLLAPIVPVLLGLSLSMMLLGVAAVLVGVGLLAFSVGLAALAASGGAAALVVAGMITTLLGLVPLVISTLIEALIIFANGIVKAAPIVGAAILGLMTEFLDIIIKITPKIIETLATLLKALITLIVDMIPDFVEAILTLIGELLSQLAAKIPEFVQSGMDILMGFLEGIRDNIGDVVTVAGEIIVEFLTAIAAELPNVVQAGWDLVLAFINSMADSVDANLGAIIAAMGRLAANMISGLVAGITAGAASVLKALKDIVDAAIKAIMDKLLMKSPSKVMAKLGTYIPLGLIVGIKAIKAKLISTMKNMGTIISNTMSDTIALIAEAFTGDLEMTPVIRPVVDLTDVVYGGQQIDALIGKKGINLVAVMNKIAAVATKGEVNVDKLGRDLTSEPNIQLTQINNSPKALSRVEIYRQTRNQLLTLKGLV